MKTWTKLEKLKITNVEAKEILFFPELPRLQIFDANITVDESIFETLAKSPDLEVAKSFILDSGSTSSFFIVCSTESII